MPLHDLTPQLRTRLRRMEKVVGLFVAVAAALMAAGFAYYLYHTAERKGWFTPKVPYYAYVQSADGLHVGDPVMLMGFSVGEITLIEAEPPDSGNNVFVGFAVKKPYYGYLWSDSKVKVAGGSFLGGRQLEVTKGRTGAPTVYEEAGRVTEVLVGDRRVPFGEELLGVPLPTEESPGLAERADQLVAQIEQALPPITEKLDAVLANAQRLSANLDGVVGKTQPIVANLDAITTHLRNPHGSLGEWMLPPELHAKLNGTLDTIDSNLILLRGTLHDVDQITSTLRTKLDENPNLVGEVSTLVRDTDDLVQGLKRHWLLRSAFSQPVPGEPQIPLAPLLGPPERDKP
ncbi:MAG TPA: MlaD family protein [Myxococcota bacterium]|nr:MlaD family protein [Myxococcota bacterium]